MGIEREPGLADYLGEAATLEDVVRTVKLSQPLPDKRRRNGAKPAEGGEPERSIDCIPAGSPVSTAPELLESPRMQELLRTLRGRYDLVVLDGSPILAVADSLEIAPHADALLVCVRTHQTTREQARAVRSALGHLSAKPAGAVLTGLHRGDESYGYYYAY
jgi:Mrp family chromosome partitioning ATPase